MIFLEDVEINDFLNSIKILNFEREKKIFIFDKMEEIKFFLLERYQVLEKIFFYF